MNARQRRKARRRVERGIQTKSHEPRKVAAGVPKGKSGSWKEPAFSAYARRLEAVKLCGLVLLVALLMRACAELVE